MGSSIYFTTATKCQVYLLLKVLSDKSHTWKLRLGCKSCTGLFFFVRFPWCRKSSAREITLPGLPKYSWPELLAQLLWWCPRRKIKLPETTVDGVLSFQLRYGCLSTRIESVLLFATVCIGNLVAVCLSSCRTVPTLWMLLAAEASLLWRGINYISNCVPWGIMLTGLLGRRSESSGTPLPSRPWGQGTQAWQRVYKAVTF